MNDVDINRINELSKINKQRPLTREEQKERSTLHKRYVADMRASLRTQLDKLVIEHPDGTQSSVQKSNNNGYKGNPCA